MGGDKRKNIPKIHNIIPGIQKVLTDTSNIPMKKLNGEDREIFINLFGKSRYRELQSNT